MSASVLVLGGAGYIGSHMAKVLARAGHAVTVFDDLRTGHRDCAERHSFIEGDICRLADLDRVFSARRFDLVMHFAASCYVGESVHEPATYYRNNVLGTLEVLEAMRRHRVANLVFSSSCAVYGVPGRVPIDESHPRMPVSPYGVSKYAAERMIEDYARAYGLRAVALRYFNAAGCDPEGDLGERHNPETHLIPLVLREARRVQRGGDSAASTLEVYGHTYATRDGTCIRDYVHVNDLCMAHLLAMEKLLAGTVAGFAACNLGTERGFSVKEIVEVARRITGTQIRYQVASPRAGDPPELVASAARAREWLGWKPQYASIESIVGTAWAWFRKA